MVITFSELQMVSVLDLVDKGEFTLYASEKEMQEAILFKPELLEAGFRPMTKEMAVDPGFIDIIGYEERVDWESLLERLKTVTAEQGPVVQ